MPGGQTGMLFKRFLLPVIWLLASIGARAQSCPENIGFEDGTFNHWTCYAGTADSALGPVMAATRPLTDRHIIIQNRSPQARDPYGNFPVNCPNGSGYSIELGNNNVGAEAEGISYTYTIPAGQQNFTLIYYYAVVIQNPGHTPPEQPQFRATLTDETTDQAILNGAPQSYKSDLSCGNHTFVAGGDLSGFHISAIDPSVEYKAWTPVAINLIGYGGHTIKIAFTTNDCTKGKHFGYAYLDFNEICYQGYTGPIVGSNYCNNPDNSITLTAPAGFDDYKWYDATFSHVLGEDDVLKISPIPPDGTKYALVVTPPVDLGCTDTLFTVVKQVNEAFNLKAVAQLLGCRADGVDLTQPAVTAGSDPGMRYEYFSDPDGQHFLSDPRRVTDNGTYYIRGTNASGCTGMVPVDVRLFNGPAINITQPPPVCRPATVDITAPGITSSSVPGLVYSYFTDYATQHPLANPTAITQSGFYYVKAIDPNDPAACSSVETINVVINDLPKITSGTIKACAPVDLYTIMSSEDRSDNVFYFYTDAALTQPVNNPSSVNQSGIYYYKGMSQGGCENGVGVINVTAYQIPAFTITDPAPVVYPVTVDLSSTHTPLNFAQFTYWQNSGTTNPVADYHHITESGTYYIKATNGGGCFIIHQVHVVVNAPPEAGIAVANTFTPNSDGINDEFRPVIQGLARINYLKIFNRYGQPVFETQDLFNRWNGTRNGRPEPAGTYYWVFSSFDEYRKKTFIRSGWVTLIR